MARFGRGYVSWLALRVIDVLERLGDQRGLPRALVLDNGPEFSERALDLWAHEQKIPTRWTLGIRGPN
jgi:hypothetical protein